MAEVAHPLVSVGIPTYNQPEFLRQAIQSVLDQTFQNFEIIVVDDCSTDNTPDIVQEFEDPRIHYHRTDTNLRPPRSWNECARLAKGKYFSILPHDDLYKPKFLEKMVFALEQNPNLGFAQCAHTAVNENLNAIAERYISKDEFIARGEETLIIQTRRHYMNPASILYLKSCVDKYGFWETNYWDDEVLTLKIAFHEGFIYLPLILALVRAHSNNLSNILVSEQWDIVLEVINQQTAIFAAVLPMTSTLLKLRSQWNRQLGYSCIFYAIKEIAFGKWKNAKLFFRRAIYLYPCILVDPRLYLVAFKKIAIKIKDFLIKVSNLCLT